MDETSTLPNGSSTNNDEQMHHFKCVKKNSTAQHDMEDGILEQVAHDIVTDVIESASNSLRGGDEQEHEAPWSNSQMKALQDFSRYQVDRCHSSDEDGNSSEDLQQNNHGVENSEHPNNATDDVKDTPAYADTRNSVNTDVQEQVPTERTNSTHAVGDQSHNNVAQQTPVGSITNAGDEDLCKESCDSETAANASERADAEESKPEKDTGEKEPQTKKDEWLDVLGNGLLKKKTISPGLGSDHRPLRSQEVTISVESRLSDGTVVEDERNITFVLAEQDVVEALDLVVNLMEKGETCTIVSDAKYCYGKKGKPPNIPPDTDLTFTVELLDMQDGPYSLSTPIEKRLNWVDDRRNKGNKLYTEKSYNEALYTYKKCTRVLEQATNQGQSGEIKAEIDSYMVKCQSNLCACHMMLEEWKEALQACQKAEKLDPQNGKTLFRKGKILAKSGEMKKAVETLKRASQLMPTEKTVQTELARVTKKMQAQKEKQQKMYKRMFWGKDDKGQQMETTKPTSPDSSWGPSFNIVAGSTLIAIGAVLLGVYFLQK